jgi:sec-independent protein translocase protein TatA
MSLGLFGTIGTPELIIILFVALLMFGGRLPEVARSLGKSVTQFKRGLKDVEDELNAADNPAAQAAPPKTLPPPAPTATPTATTAVNDSTKQPQS